MWFKIAASILNPFLCRKMEKKKICSKCNINKSLSDFYFRKDTQKYRNECIECHKKTRKKYFKSYYQENKEILIKKNKEYVKNNPEKAKIWWKKYENSEKGKKYRLEYRKSEKCLENVRNRMKKYRSKKENKEKINNYVKNRLKEDEIYYLKDKIRRRINEVLRKKDLNKCKNSKDIIGCSWNELKEHLEKKFDKGMNWSNKGKWHIDHIIPISTAKSKEEVYRLNHYTNLQPLWAEDNLKKSDKY